MLIIDQICLLQKSSDEKTSLCFLALIIPVFALNIEFKYDAWLLFMFTVGTAGFYFNKHLADNG